MKLCRDVLDAPDGEYGRFKFTLFYHFRFQAQVLDGGFVENYGVCRATRVDAFFCLRAKGQAGKYYGRDK